ncbi:MAG: archaetidylserine decarboxylase [Puniceicoccales bacterium]|jgi:phosphatidylserine decarboxylase|nr:archaetidylserine decarboxylase [Puniceicoccales bacterium]
MEGSIKFYNRYTKSLEDEAVWGEFFLKFLYRSSVGRLALHYLVKRKIFSVFFGYLMRRPSSRKKIKPFVERYKIDMLMSEKKISDFTNFDEFFSRKLKKSARPIAVDHQKIVFPCDGRHLLLEDFKKLPSFYIKGQKFDLKMLLQNEELLERFKDGSAVISRLCPMDYHRFHFPCDAVIRKIYKVSGDYFAVNPLVIRDRIAILFENQRIVSVLQSSDVDQFLTIEIGATCVGSITQTAEVGRLYFKGEEKGFFGFGGSTVMTIFKKNKVVFAEDLCQNSANGIETFAFMGDDMGRKYEKIIHS